MKPPSKEVYSVHMSGAKRHFRGGKLHREDGPALEYDDGAVEWYVEGKKLTVVEYCRHLGLNDQEAVYFILKYSKA